MNISYLFVLLNNLEIVKNINPVSVCDDLSLTKIVSNQKSGPLLGLYLPLFKQITSSMAWFSAACISILNWHRQLSSWNYTLRQSKHNCQQLKHLHITTYLLDSCMNWTIAFEVPHTIWLSATTLLNFLTTFGYSRQLCLFRNLNIALLRPSPIRWRW